VVGSNTVTITVTAEDRTTTKTYTITITRAPLTAPPAPVIRVKEGTGKLTVEWDPASRATVYEVWYGHNGTSSYSPPPPQQSGGDISGTSHVITDLEDPNREEVGYEDPSIGWFKVMVYAKNDAGTSPAAEWNGHLVSVVHFVGVMSGDSQVSVSFSGSIYSRLHTNEYAVLYASFTDDLETAWEIGRDVSRPHIITGLTNGRTYYFWIRVETDAGGEGDWSSVSVTPRITAPQIALIPGDARIWVEWGLIPSASSYEVWYYETASGSETAQMAGEEIQSNPDIPLYSRTIEGLANTREYTVYVKTKSEYDSRDGSAKTAIPLPPPDAPAAPTLTPGIGQIEAGWTAVNNATSYAIYYHTADNSSQAMKYAEVPGTSVTIKGLAHNTRYYVWLRAKNGAAPGEFSPSASAATPASGAITAGFDGGITITDGSGTDVSGGFVIGTAGQVTLSAFPVFGDVKWYVDGSLVAGNPITLNGASYNDHRDHSVSFTGTKGGNLYSSDPIPFRATP
jgi:hypothetical protein